MYCDQLIVHLIQKTFCRRVILLVLIWTLSANSDKVYTNEFVVYMNGDTETAKQLAARHGFKFLGKIFENCYHLKSKRITKRSINPAQEEHYNSIQSEEQVISVQQQIVKRRVKRDFIGTLESSSFNDPKWSHMWYLNRGHGLDMNVQPVWEQNITGKNVVVTILDDGLEKDHPDIVDNYDPLASFDVNNHDEDPMPRYDMIDSNRHGTRCAGEVAARANNSICAIGVAYDAKVGGVRMLDGDVTDAVEARSLSLNPQHIHIYSASWGPDDDGKTVDGPGDLATKAFIEGVTKGRNGLGSIFIWASGNGGREHDNCNCDGYTNSIWTLSISSATENGLVPWYSEACSSTLATTYSSGSYGERQIVTTDLHHGCTDSHTGTSASAPLAAGICALVLDANSNLTWRDMQHIVVYTSKPANLRARDWKTNGIGRNVSHSFGYGLLDAYAMVEVAKNWITVPQQKTCEVHSQPIDKMIPAKSHVELSLRVHCDNVHYLEHVQARVTLTASRRGDIHIYLTSPAGTRATLLAQRPMDNSRAGFQNWPFMSVHTWGENPNGDWKLEIHNEGRYYNAGTLPSLLGRATLKNWTVILYGTSEYPDRRKVKTYSTLSERARFQTVKPTSSISAVNSKEAGGGGGGPGVKETGTKKGTMSPLIPFNSIEDSGSSEVALSDSQRNSNHNEEEYLTYHGTRADKSDTSHHDRSKGLNVSGGCAFSQSLSLCLECEPAYALWNNLCVTVCPEGYFTAETVQYPNKKLRKCLKCHYTCKECKGAQDNQCTTCHSDAKLHHHGYCNSKELVQEVVALERWYTAVTVVFLCLCFLILVLVVYIVTERNPHLICWCRSSRHHTLAYDGLPLRTAERNSSVLKLNIVEGQTPSAPFQDDHSEDDL